MTKQEKNKIFKSLGLKSKLDGTSFGGDWYASTDDWLDVRSPVTGELLARVQQTGGADFN